MQWQLKVNSIDVTSYWITGTIDRAYGDAIAQSELYFVNSVNSVVTLQTGQTVS